MKTHLSLCGHNLFMPRQTGLGFGEKFDYKAFNKLVHQLSSKRILYAKAESSLSLRIDWAHKALKSVAESEHGVSLLKLILEKDGLMTRQEITEHPALEGLENKEKVAGNILRGLLKTYQGKYNGFKGKHPMRGIRLEVELREYVKNTSEINRRFYRVAATYPEYVLYFAGIRSDRLLNEPKSITEDIEKRRGVFAKDSVDSFEKMLEKAEREAYPLTRTRRTK